MRWSGESTWIPLGEFEVGVGFENHTSHPAPGEILLYPGGFSETEILLPYGGCMFASIVGQLAGNHFLTVVEGNENLRALGERPSGRAPRTSSSTGYMTTIVRAQVLHTPRDPFAQRRRAGGVLRRRRRVRRDGRILATRRRSRDVRARTPGRRGASTSATPSCCPASSTRTSTTRRSRSSARWASSCSTGCATRTLPEEARLADTGLRARGRAARSCAGSPRNGTTTALVFGSHFPAAQEALFDGGRAVGPADRERPRRLRPQPAARSCTSRPTQRLRAEPRARSSAGTAAGACATRSRRASRCPARRRCSRRAGRCSRERRRRAASPATSTRTRPRSQFVAELFPWARDYLDTYERYGLVGRRSVLRPRRPRHRRRAAAAGRGAARASRTARRATRSWRAGSSRCAATTRTACASRSAPTSAPAPGLSLFKEGLMAYHVQMVRTEGGS